MPDETPAAAPAEQPPIVNVFVEPGCDQLSEADIAHLQRLLDIDYAENSKEMTNA